MPVSVVCESTANAVTAALRESLGGGGSNNGSCSSAASADPKAAMAGMSGASPISSAGGGGSGDVDSLQNKLVASAKRVLMSTIEYEEANNYGQSVLDSFKSKYIVLKPNPATAVNGGSIGNNNGKAENGRGAASPATCNGVSNMNGGSSIIINGSSADVNGNTSNSACGTVSNNKRIANSNTTNNPNELPQPKRVLFPREEVRIGWKSTSRKWQVGVGMMNVGNTCYLNSTLQAIFHVPSMANWLLSDSKHQDQCNGDDVGCIICAMAKTLHASQSAQSAIRPYFVYSKLKGICKHLVMGRQEDAHEFLRYLVEAMEKSYLTRFRNHKDLDQYSKETTPLNQILGGYLRSAVRCLDCMHVSVTFQHFQDLLLDIRKADTIEDALDGYFSRERLEDMGYKCESCKKKVSATKQFSLERPPIALCIQLKRFSMAGAKLNKHITIKPRLDLSRFASRKTSNGGEQFTYRLVAMVTHLGASQHCGHYTAIGVTESGTYYNYDDSCVRPISIQQVCNTNAYIIFYELDDSPAIRQTTSTQVSGAESKENYQKMNGYTIGGSQITNTHSPQRLIGPQLPPNGLKCANSSSSSYPNGSKLNIHRQGSMPTGNASITPKITIHYKNTNGNLNPIAKSSSTSTMATMSTVTSNGCNNNNSKQNGLQLGAGNFQEPANTKPVLADPSVKAQVATVSNGNNKIISTTATNSVELSSSSHMERKNTNSATTTSINTTTKATLPSMPKLFDITPVCRKLAISPVPACTNTTLKSLVPYDSGESEDDDFTEVNTNSTDVLRRIAVKQFPNAKNPLKRRSSDSSSAEESSDNDVGQKLMNGIKVKKSGTTTSSLTMTVTNGNVCTTAAKNTIFSSPSKIKQKTDTATADSNNLILTAGRNNNSSLTKQQQSNQKPQQHLGSGKVAKSLTVMGSVNNGIKSDSKDTLDDVRPLFQRSQSTPPSPPVIKTKTGYWQVTTLQPSKDAGMESDNKTTSKNPRNPFGQQSSSKSTSELFSKRTKMDKQQQHARSGGYHRDSTSDSAINELLKQSHRGYGGSVLTWDGSQSEIEREVMEEAREQRQRDWKDEQENEMDRGRQKKIKANGGIKDYVGSLPSGFNPFQEHDNQRRWNKPHGGGHNSHGHHHQSRGLHLNQFRHQYQRNKFKFQRFNYKRLPHQRYNNSNNGGGSNKGSAGSNNRRDS